MYDIVGVVISIALVGLLVIITSLALVLVLKELHNTKLTKAVAAIRRMLVTDEEGVSLSRDLDVEFGRLRVTGVNGRRGYRSFTEFAPSSKLLLGKIRYRDLCSGGYLLAIDSEGNGYLDAPAIRVSTKPFRNVFIACLDPLEVNTLNKSIEIVEETSAAKSIINVSNGRYSAKLSWTSLELPSWRLVYDPKRGSYRIVKEPGMGARVRSVRVEICAKSLGYLTPEVCATIIRLARVDTEASGMLEGLSSRRLVVAHMANINLLKLAKEVGIDRYPHISGYSSGYVKAKLTFEVSMARDIVREELI